MSGFLPSPVIFAAAPDPSSTAPVAEEEEFYSSWSLFLVCVLLIISLWTSYYLQIKRIRAIHETLVSIFAGMIVGLVVRLAPGTMIRDMLTFRHTLFFNLLLPPIILNSGYELKQENFFRNFGSILTFAFLGTFISAVGVGVLVYIYSFLGLESLNVSLIECLIFGSTLSATDPVTILAIFNQYKVDPKLYTVIFGESLLNDAVSIVMYETLSQFHGTEIAVGSFFHGIGIFLLSFSVSMALGVAFGLAMSLVLKHSSLSHYSQIETCLVALSAYTCYFFSNGTQMSGIVSLLFCGITLKHYAYHTMSRRTQRATKYIFATLAQLSENFIFIYLGLSLFTSPPSSTKVTSYVKPLFITITTVAVVFTRYAAVFPLSEAINFFHRHARGQRTEELPHSYQMMLFWAGLRGAVGVALAAGFKGENAQTLKITVLAVVVLTVIVFGGTTARMLEVLGIRTGVEDDAASSSDEEDNIYGSNRWLNSANARRNNAGRWANYMDDDDHYLPPQQQPFTYGRANRSGAGRIGMHYDYDINQAASSDSYDSDVEVLPLASTAVAGDGSPNPASGKRSPGGRNVETGSPQPPSTPTTATAEEGKWFQALDERYLLPLFSNATASRTFHARKARRTTSGIGAGLGLSGGSGSGSRGGTPIDSDEEGDDTVGGTELDLTGVTTGRRPSPLSLGTSGSGGPGAGHGSTPMGGATEFVRMTDESRSERGLNSPILRRDSEGGVNRDRTA
ncbi:Sodium/hydrogen exchanger [Abortiporus biennis]